MELADGGRCVSPSPTPCASRLSPETPEEERPSQGACLELIPVLTDILKSPFEE